MGSQPIGPQFTVGETKRVTIVSIVNVGDNPYCPTLVLASEGKGDGFAMCSIKHNILPVRNKEVIIEYCQDLAGYQYWKIISPGKGE